MHDIHRLHNGFKRSRRCGRGDARGDIHRNDDIRTETSGRVDRHGTDHSPVHIHIFTDDHGIENTGYSAARPHGTAGIAPAENHFLAVLYVGGHSVKWNFKFIERGEFNTVIDIIFQLLAFDETIVRNDVIGHIVSLYAQRDGLQLIWA